MSLKLYAMTCGWLTGKRGFLLEGGEGEITVPIPAYLIDHPKGTLLFDTGLHPDCQRDPAFHVGATIAGAFRFHYAKGEEVSARLEAMDRDPARIDLIVNSHLHFDHVGGNASIPNATVLVQRREWEFGKNPDPADIAYIQRDYEHGHKLKLIDGEHDLFGDGSVVLLPTQGHTIGHQSLKLRLESGTVVLAADACYLCQSLRERRLPAASYDRAQALATLDRLAQLERNGARIFFGHDPEFWQRIPQAPKPVL